MMGDVVYDGTLVGIRRICDIVFVIIGNDDQTLELQVIMARTLELVFYGFNLQKGGQQYKDFMGIEVYLYNVFFKKKKITSK